jgi:hypothetical protein
MTRLDMALEPARGKLFILRERIRRALAPVQNDAAAGLLETGHRGSGTMTYAVTAPWPFSTAPYTSNVASRIA